MNRRLLAGLASVTAVAAAFLAAQLLSVSAQPVANITLPAPGGAVQLYAGCNNLSLTFPDGTPSEEVVQTVTPPGAVESMWRHSAALGRFEGFNPAFPGASDLPSVDFLNAVWLCMTTAPGATAPPPAPPPPSCPGPPVVASFTANPGTITAGDSSTLSWGPVENTDHVVIDQGIGEVGGWDSMVVSPTTTTTYTLTATGCGGVATHQVTVVVNAALPPPGGGSWGILTADLEMTAIFADNLPQGKVYARVINHGPHDVTGVGANLSCDWLETPTMCFAPPGQACIPVPVPYASLAFITLNQASGQTAEYYTGIDVNTLANRYDITCEINVIFSDPNTANNKRTVTIQ